MFCQTVMAVKMAWQSLAPCKRTVFPIESRTSGDNGFRIKISGKPEPVLYQADKAYTGKHFRYNFLFLCIDENV